MVPTDQQRIAAWLAKLEAQQAGIQELLEKVHEAKRLNLIRPAEPRTKPARRGKPSRPKKT